MTGDLGRWQWAWLGGLGLLLLAFAAPLVPLGAEDLRMAGLFSIDEADIATEAQNVYRGGPFRAPSFKYGGAFYYLPQPLLFLLGLLGAVSERSVIIALRVCCVASGIGCLWLTCRIGVAAFGRTAGLAAAFLLLVSPTFLRWTVEAHPDLPQLFWILASLYASVRMAQAFRARWVVMAAAFAGAAFGTKYAGGFLLPVVALAVVLSAGGEGVKLEKLKRHLLSRRCLLAMAAIPTVFVLAFAVTTPFALIRFDAFRESLMAERQIMNFGHTYEADPRGVLWLGFLADAVGRIHIPAFVACILAGIGSAVSNRHVRGDRTVILIWVAVFLGYLTCEVHLRRTRHLLPILPCAYLIVAYGYSRALDWIRGKIPRLGASAVLLPLLLAGLSWSQIAGAVGLFEGKRARMDGIGVEVAAARWMEDRFLPETSILYDAYAYVPSSFANAYRSFGMAYSTVSHFEPDLLVVRQATAGEYADPENASRARMGEQAFLDRHYFYAYLRRGLIPDYRRARDFGPLAVYERIAPKIRDDAEPTRRWRKLLTNYRQKKAHGMMESHRTMGDIHASLGLSDLAERQYARARRTTNYPARLYRMACRELSSGRIVEAGRAFGEVATIIASKPHGERAKIRAQMIRDLARQGISVEQAERMLEVHLEGDRSP